MIRHGMDGFTLTDGLVKSLAWPVAAVVMVILLRNPLAKLIPLLRKLKYKEWEAEFSEKLDRVEKTAAAAAQSTTPVPVAAEGELSPQERLGAELDAADASVRYSKLLEFSPPSAMYAAWSDFEAAVQEAATRLRLPPATGGLPEIRESVPGLARRFYENKWLTLGQYRLLGELAALRRFADHPGKDESITAADATRFLALVSPFVRYFNLLTPNSPKVSDGAGQESKEE